MDLPYQNLRNDANDEQRFGDLILEIVCAHAVHHQDAISVCQNYVNHVAVPQEGQHIVVTGPYVLDTDHGWTEIHTVHSLSILYLIRE